MRSRRLHLIAAVFLALVGGCAGSGAGLDANGDPLGSGTAASAPLEANFDSIQAHVFTPICSVCHVGAAAPHGLRLDAANSYNLLVNVSSDEVPGTLRVKPGDPDNSYIIQKLQGNAAVGARMPFGGPYLPAEVIAVIRQWVSDGAAGPSAAAQLGTFQITVAVPANNEILPAPPPQVMVGFNHELDLTRIEPRSLQLQRWNASKQSAEAVPARIQVPSNNAKALLLWPRQPLQDGRYWLVIPAGAIALTDLAGRDLERTDLARPSPSDGPTQIISTFDVTATP